MNERLVAIVSGRVQMVGFRDFVYKKALELELAGQVRNLPDGGVEVVAEGSREKLEKLLAKLHKGPLFSHVEGVMPNWLPATNAYTEFSIQW